MQRSFSVPSAFALRRKRLVTGFTLVEVMIVVAIIAILAAVAIPSYQDYALRGRLVDGINLLSAAEANMERYFQDNRTYQPAGARFPPCHANVPVAQRTAGNFVLTCAAPDVPPTGTTYTLRVTGSGSVNGVVYTVDEQRTRRTLSLGSTGWTVPAVANCWIAKRGQAC